VSSGQKKAVSTQNAALQNERDEARTRNHQIDSPGENITFPDDSSRKPGCLSGACQNPHPEQVVDPDLQGVIEA
jgi:hypothetical protein